MLLVWLFFLVQIATFIYKTDTISAAFFLVGNANTIGIEMQISGCACVLFGTRPKPTKQTDVVHIAAAVAETRCRYGNAFSVGSCNFSAIACPMP